MAEPLTATRPALADPWFVQPPQRPGKLRLYCFAHGGGNALGFIPWRPLLDPAIELHALQLPGRGARAHEAPVARFEQLVDDVAGAIDAAGGPPFAFFGHSMGALLAFEVARACRAAGRPGPRQLLLSGCASPRRQRPFKGVHLLPDDELLSVVGTLNGIPPQVLKMRALMQRNVAALRADFALMAGYRYRAEPALATPLTLLYGRLDRLTGPRALAEWSLETTKPCAWHGFDGDHFFINTARTAVLDLIQRTMLAA